MNFVADTEEDGLAPTFVSPVTISMTPEKSRATISCYVSGKPMPHIKWYKDNVDIAPSEILQTFYDEQSGYVSLEILNPNYGEVTVYTVIAENTYGKAVGKATMTAEEDTDKPKEILQAPTIEVPLQAQVVKTGSTVVISVKFDGKPLPTISWLRNGKPLEDDSVVKIVTEHKQSTVTIKNAERRKVGKFEVIAINKLGEARSSASVVVSDVKETPDIKAPRFIQPLVPKVVREGDVVILEAVVDSKPLSSFQWSVNVQPITVSRDVRIVTHDNKSILIIRSFQKHHVGSYVCRAENVGGSVTSTASVKLRDITEVEEVIEYISPRFTEKLPLKADLWDGETIELKCKVMGKPIPHIEWYHNNSVIEDAKNVTVSQDNTGNCILTITEVFPEDAGEYSCHAINEVGEAITMTHVAVEGTFIVYILCMSTSNT